MKKFLHKDKKDKEEKKKEKKEKKEKKDKEKKKKKDKHSASTSSLEVPDSPGPSSQTTTVETTTTTIPSGGATKTITVKETLKETSGLRVSEKKTEENVTGDKGGTNVIKKTTTTTVTESKPDQPVETKTVVKETTSKTPQGEEKVVVTKTSSEVQSVPSTREFLTENFLKSADVEIKRTVQPASQHVSERTVIKESNDGGQTVKTVTKVVADEEGRRETTVTTSSGAKNEEDDAKLENSPEETKTVVKETTSKTPQGEEKVVVTKTSSEVQSVPSTREFLTENLLKSADVEIKRTVQPASQHVSERTVIKESNDGGQTVKNVTKVVSDEEGRRETTVTTSSGAKNEEDDAKLESSPEELRDEDEKDEKGITSENLERKADLPGWLNDIPSTNSKIEAKIDDSIEIPTPPLQRKEPQDKPKPVGTQVVEEVFPVSDSKENLLDIVDDLDYSGETKPTEEKPKPPEEIPFTYEPKKTEKKVYTGQPVTEQVDTVESANKAESSEIDFARLDRKEEPKPARIVQQTHTRKTISTNGDTVQTVTTTETVTDKDGKVKQTETKTISVPDQKPRQNQDINFNIIETKKAKESPKTSKRNFRDETSAKNAKNIIEDNKDDDTDDDREVLEEIIVIEKKRKVRIPKSFVPYEKERPRAVLPIDMLIERQSRPRKIPPVGRRVDEKVVEKTQNRKSEIPDLDELDNLLSAMEAERSQ